MAAQSEKIGNTVRGITRKALTQGKLDRAALRRVTGDLRKNLKHVERLIEADLRRATRAGKDAASQGVNATLVSGALMARIGAGMLAGIADTLAQKPPRRAR